MVAVSPWQAADWRADKGAARLRCAAPGFRVGREAWEGLPHYTSCAAARLVALARLGLGGWGRHECFVRRTLVLGLVHSCRRPWAASGRAFAGHAL